VAAARIGQHRFAQGVLANRDHSCGFCGMRPGRELERRGLLIASHLKPWRDSTGNERVDTRNGIAAYPSHDAAFDGGLLWVNGGYRIHLSHALADAARSDVGLVAAHDSDGALVASVQVDVGDDSGGSARAGDPNRRPRGRPVCRRRHGGDLAGRSSALAAARPATRCTQATITVPPAVNAKTAQRHHYTSKAWRRSYARRSAGRRSQRPDQRPRHHRHSKRLVTAHGTHPHHPVPLLRTTISSRPQPTHPRSRTGPHVTRRSVPRQAHRPSRRRPTEPQPPKSTSHRPLPR
jgi:hypothetical protein